MTSETFSAFFYGSLMSKTVLIRVLLGPNVSEEDKCLKLNSIRFTAVSIKGYGRSSLKGEDYPAMIYAGNETDTFEGLLAEGLTKKDINSLDTFEGDWYKRIPVQVSSGKDISIETEGYLYIGDPELLTHTEWSFEDFIKSGKEKKWLDDRCTFYDVDSLHA